jgi:hypothetical protein
MAEFCFYFDRDLGDLRDFRDFELGFSRPWNGKIGKFGKIGFVGILADSEFCVFGVVSAISPWKFACDTRVLRVRLASPEPEI